MDAALKALAEPRRREILRLVWHEELPAAQIAARFGDVTRSAVSQHLGVLREAALVTERRDGTRRLYRADHGQMDRLRQFLDEYWTGSVQRLQHLAESAERETESAEREAESAERETESAEREKGNNDG